MQADGKILVGGEFSTLGGKSRSRLGRLNADGSVDLTFNPGADYYVNTLAVQADGKILVGGFFTTLGGESRSNLGRLNADGSVDLTFNPGANGTVYTLASQADGKILVGGYFTTLGGESRSRLGRLNADGSVDLTFNPGADGSVYTLAVQADGKILVGGGFSTLGGESRNYLGRLNADGTVDLTFNPGATYFVGTYYVYTLAVQADGKILVGGEFTTLGGQSRSRLGRLNADGTVDLTFNPGADYYVYTLAVQADGKILVGGWFSTLGGESRNYLGRLNADGTVDLTFNPGATYFVGTYYVYTLAVQADGKILVGGNFDTLGGKSRSRLGRLNADGSVDLTFNPGANGSVHTLAVQADGKILVGWDFTTLGGERRSRLGRLNADGSVDLTFNPGADYYVDTLAVQADGKILVGGNFTTLGGESRKYLGRLNNTGAATQSLGYDGAALTWLRGGTSPEVSAVVFEHSADGLHWTHLGVGERVVGGWALSGANVPAGGTLRGRGQVSDGHSSTWWTEAYWGAPVWITTPASRVNDAQTTAMFSALARGSEPLSYQWFKNGVPLADGGKVAGSTGPTLTLSGVLKEDAGLYTVTVSNSEGSLTSAAAELTVNDPAITVQPASQNRESGQGVAFSVTAVGTVPLAYQWSKDGVALADGQNVSGATGSTLTLSDLQGSDAGLYTVTVSNASGSMTSASAALTVNLVTSETVFNPGADYYVNTLAVQADGKILVGGAFTMLGGESRSNLGRLNADGSVDLTFDPGADWSVLTLALQADGKILVGGEFSTLGGKSRSNLGRLNADGSVDLTFNPGASGPVYTLALQADGKILVGGWFSTLGGKNRKGLGRLNADGSVDLTFNPGASGPVYTLALQADGKILVGGEFTTLGGESRKYLGRLNADGSVDLTFNPGADGSVSTLAVQADGKILVRGNFDTLGGQSRKYLGRLNADGSVDLTFNPGANDYVSTLALQADGKILVGGNFDTLGGQSRKYLGRLYNTGAATQSLGYDGAALTWLRGGTGPEFGSTSFAYSTDDILWTDLGMGERIPGGWRLAGVSLPASCAIRAQGRVSNGSSTWLVETAARIEDVWREGPDLVVSSLEAPLQALAGTTQPLVWTIANRGSHPVAGDWVDRVYLSLDQGVSHQLLVGEFPASGPLGVNESRERHHTVLLPADLLPGLEYWWIVITDDDDDVAEEHEGNNVRIGETPLRVLQAAAPNLQVTAVAVPAAAASGQPMIVTWTVTNTGTSSTGAEVWHDAVHLSTDEELDEGDHLLGQVVRPDALGTDQAYDSTLAATLPQGISGSWYLLVTTDVDNTIHEDLFEHDNTVVARLTVLMPPTIATHPQGVSAIEGDEVTFTVVATGTEPMEYSWSLNGSPIPNSNNPVLRFGAITAEDAGVYQVVISNTVGTVTSNSATLEVVRLTLRILTVDGVPVIEWSGTARLEWTDRLMGEWHELQDASSPFTIVPEGSGRFYRLVR